LDPVVNRIKEVREDYPAASHKPQHKEAHALALQDATTKVTSLPYFQEKTEPEASPQDDKAA
jgi:hypothetical protein